MAGDDYTRLYLSGPRHAPKADVAAPDVIRHHPVASFSNPAGHGQSWVSTGSIMNQTRRVRRGGGSAMSAPDVPEGPLSGLGEAQAEIIGASGLGKQKNRGV